MLDFSEARYQAVNYIVDKMWKTSSENLLLFSRLALILWSNKNNDYGNNPTTS